jgi:ribosomal protein L31E
MREIDQMLFNAGFELPWTELSLSPIDYGKEEKVYPKGYAYYAYKDILDIIKEAKNEVIVTDNFADEELINLYLEKIPEKVRIRVLTKEPKGNFMVVAKKFKTKPNVDFEVRKSMDWHDRWVFVDNGCWVLGQSVKDAGMKPTYLVKLEAYDLLKKAFDEVWNKASLLI